MAGIAGEGDGLRRAPAAEIRALVQVGSTSFIEAVAWRAVFLHRFAFELSGLAHRASDNFFAHFPGEPRRVPVSFGNPVRPDKVRRARTFRSLADIF